MLDFYCDVFRYVFWKFYTPPKVGAEVWHSSDRSTPIKVVAKSQNGYVLQVSNGTPWESLTRNVIAFYRWK